MPVWNLASRLPEIETVRRWSQALAVLDAIVSPAPEYRYFSFNADWDGDQLASMRNGSGDEYSIVFTGEGAVYLRGFDHEAAKSPFVRTPPRPWPGVVDDVPPAFRRFVTEPSFCIADVPAVTVCLWRSASDTDWKHGPVALPDAGGDPDGADWLFAELDGRAVTYQRYAREYFEKEIGVDVIDHVYGLRPLTEEVVSTLNSDRSVADLAEDIAEIGYPTT